MFLWSWCAAFGAFCHCMFTWWLCSWDDRLCVPDWSTKRSQGGVWGEGISVPLFHFCSIPYKSNICSKCSDSSLHFRTDEVDECKRIPEQEAVGWRFLAQLTCFDNFFDLDLIWCPTAIVRNAISICTSFERPEFYRGIKLRPVGSCWAIVQERCVFVKNLRVSLMIHDWHYWYISDIIWLRFVCPEQMILNSQ